MATKNKNKNKNKGKRKDKAKGVNKKKPKAKKKPAKKRVELKILGKSVLVDEDLGKREHKMGLRAPRAGKGEIPSFYRKFVFKCGKCVSEFEHTAEIPVIEQMVICPECDQIHAIRIRLITGHYEIEFPKSIREVKERKSRRR